MHINWYKRLLISYLPIIFVIISVLVFISFLLIGNVSENEAKRANHIFTRYAVQAVESDMKGIETDTVSEVEQDPNIRAFFNYPTPSDVGAEINYKVAYDINTFISKHPLIYSIYFYRFNNDTLLTPNYEGGLSDFPDKKFIEQQIKQPSLSSWTAPRYYTEFGSVGDDSKILMCSMSKQALPPFGKQGLIIINVNMSKIYDKVEPMVNNLTYIKIKSHGHDLYPAIENTTQPSAQNIPKKIITTLRSGYLNLTFESGILSWDIFGFVSIISYIWIVFGLLTILLGIYLIIYISKRNYKPIEKILGQIYAYQSRTAAREQTNDEFDFIERSIEQLIETTNQYKLQNQKDLITRKKQYFLDLISSENKLTHEEIMRQLDNFNMNLDFDRLAVAVAEIDHYAAFQKEYSLRDQNLLKFALNNAANEIVRNHGRQFWGEWISGNHFAIVIFEKTSADPDPADSLFAMMDKLRDWVKFLNMTVTIGVGGQSDSLTGIHRSFAEALAALQYKMPLGSNRIIRYAEFKEMTDEHYFRYLQRIRQIVDKFRIDSAWIGILTEFFDAIQKDLLKDEDIKNLLNYMVFLFHREMETMPGAVSSIWHQSVRSRLVQVVEETETLNPVKVKFHEELSRLYQSYQDILGESTRRNDIHEIRAYIERNFADPQLSLSALSSKYSINGKYLSQLFKEEFNVKFIDFLVSLRMDYAKKLLTETDTSISEIAEKVGYTTSISFGRTFKKIAGVTPREYRRIRELGWNGKTNGAS